MKWSIAILLGVLGALAQHPSGAAQSRYQRQGTEATPIADAFVSAFSEVKAKSRVAVLLPSELPQPVVKAEHAVVETASEDQYAISLYYELGVGDSGFAASFAANAHPNYGPKDIPNVNGVTLSRGLIGYFRPVSCGGSCAPANLWWEENQVLYQIQLRLPSTFPEHDQRSAIVAVANSAILAGPR